MKEEGDKFDSPGAKDCVAFQKREGEGGICVAILEYHAYEKETPERESSRELYGRRIEDYVSPMLIAIVERWILNVLDYSQYRKRNDYDETSLIASANRVPVSYTHLTLPTIYSV